MPLRTRAAKIEAFERGTELSLVLNVSRSPAHRRLVSSGLDRFGSAKLQFPVVSADAGYGDFAPIIKCKRQADLVSMQKLFAGRLYNANTDGGCRSSTRRGGENLSECREDGS